MIRAAWIKLEKEWILWRTRRLIKQIDKKLTKHAIYMARLKKNTDSTEK